MSVFGWCRSALLLVGVSRQESMNETGVTLAELKNILCYTVTGAVYDKFSLYTNQVKNK